MSRQAVADSGQLRAAAAPTAAGTGGRNDTISMDPTLVATLGRDGTEAALRAIVRSVRFELFYEECAFRLLGPEMSYHRVDPHLPKALERYGANLSLNEIQHYRARHGLFDLCFEDSWTSFFLADHLRETDASSAIVLIHLDDHTDMMSTLLEHSRGTLRNVSTGAVFDPSSCADWERAIGSGGVNIGNYITPLFYAGRQIHVRHLNNHRTSPLRRSAVAREPCRYPLIPGREFAALSRTPEASSGFANAADLAGTCVTGADPEEVLESLSPGWVCVHLDLDYFINDFDGASRGDDYIPDSALAVEGRRKMTNFFRALARVNRRVDHWVIGTSPGFCSAYHWNFLLAELEVHIRRFSGM